MTNQIPPRDHDEARAVYLRFRQLFGTGVFKSNDAKKREKRVEGASVPFGAGRDPLGLSAVIDGLTSNMGWTSPLETAEHSTPTGIEDGVLTIQCDSTAWATQLRLMRTQITTHIALRYPDAKIQSVRFEGPNAPSWKRGPRSIPGRGPRDTYG
jgi:hypothetical protein